VRLNNKELYLKLMEARQQLPVGVRLIHKNGHPYRVTGHVFDVDSTEICVIYERIGLEFHEEVIPFSRRLSDFGNFRSF